MERYLRPQMFCEPVAELRYFTLGIVVARYQQGGDLEVDLGLLYKPLQRIEDRL